MNESQADERAETKAYNRLLVLLIALLAALGLGIVAEHLYGSLASALTLAVTVCVIAPVAIFQFRSCFNAAAKD